MFRRDEYINLYIVDVHVVNLFAPRGVNETYDLRRGPLTLRRARGLRELKRNRSSVTMYYPNLQSIPFIEYH